jgi:Helix-turn-helix domain
MFFPKAFTCEMPFAIFPNFALRFPKQSQTKSIIHFSTQTVSIVMMVELITKADLQVFKEEILSEIKKIVVPTSIEKKYLQSAEVRKILGISPGTLQHYRATQKLPFSKIGGKIYYNIADVNKLFENVK